jgi:hypothetical protein
MVTSIAAVTKQQPILLASSLACDTHFAIRAAPRNRVLWWIGVVELEVQWLACRRLVVLWNLEHARPHIDTVVQLVDS